MLQIAKGWDFATGRLPPGMEVKRAERLHCSWASISSTSLIGLPRQELMMHPSPNRKTMPSLIVGQSRHHPALRRYSWGGGPMISHCAFFFESYARQSTPRHITRSTVRVSSALRPAYIPHVPCLEQADQSASRESIIGF